MNQLCYSVPFLHYDFLGPVGQHTLWINKNDLQKQLFAYKEKDVLKMSLHPQHK